MRVSDLFKKVANLFSPKKEVEPDNTKEIVIFAGIDNIKDIDETGGVGCAFGIYVEVGPGAGGKKTLVWLPAKTFNEDDIKVLQRLDPGDRIEISEQDDRALGLLLSSVTARIDLPRVDFAEYNVEGGFFCSRRRHRGIRLKV